MPGMNLNAIMPSNIPTPLLSARASEANSYSYIQQEVYSKLNQSKLAILYIYFVLSSIIIILY
jgi:hypothetical protein